MHEPKQFDLENTPLPSPAYTPTRWSSSSIVTISTSGDRVPSAMMEGNGADVGERREDGEEEPQGFPSALIANFRPSFFASTMGTGIVSILLYGLPYRFEALEYIAIAVFVANIALFSSGLVVGILHYAADPSRWKKMLEHPVESLYTGVFPMGFSTIIAMMTLACVPYWGQWVATLAWVFWIIEAVISVVVCLYIPFLLVIRHKPQPGNLGGMSAAWLLPIITTIVCPATGAMVAESMMKFHPQRALGTVVACFVILGMGLPTAFIVLTVYFHRLTTHGLPKRELAVSVCLPLGPLGQGAFCFMHMGNVARYTMPLSTNKFPDGAGDMLYTFGFAAGILLWGFALFWAFFAVASLITFRRFPVNKTWWAFTFPVGVVATATTTFARELDSGFFRVLGTMISLLVVLLWILVSIVTTRRMYKKGYLGGRVRTQTTEGTDEGGRRVSVAGGKRRVDHHSTVMEGIDGRGKVCSAEASADTTTTDLKKLDV